MATPTISAQFLRHVANCVELTGRSPAPLLAEFAIARDLLDDPEQVIPLTRFLGFFERAAEFVRNPHFGLHAGRLAGSDSLGPLSFLFLSAPTLHEAFASFTRNLAPLQQASRHRFLVGPWATFEYAVQDSSLTERRQDAEYSIGAMYSLARQFAGSDVELREVRFEHERVGDYAIYRDYFGCDVFFAQDCNTLSFDARLLDLRGRVLSPVLHPILEEHLRRRSDLNSPLGGMAHQVKTIIEATPLDRPPTIAGAARVLGLSPATLHRRLQAEGTGWRELLTEHRLMAAARLLRNSRRSISEIALAVGFSESASFIRSFARHFGLPPGRYRKQ
ncbi:AraC family transcriptional regulator [Novosphingobium sp. FKTRR1]|uniref:AraC family transcriptional regulator n=1 Tax=unclassified Novosphingobium TaxID=2644732 RepID=UPI001CF06CD3|nr:AraC family transcriptional regulator [Novosphingobium sp. FKTRR1]